MRLRLHYTLWQRVLAQLMPKQTVAGNGFIIPFTFATRLGGYRSLECESFATTVTEHGKSLITAVSLHCQWAFLNSRFLVVLANFGLI